MKITFLLGNGFDIGLGLKTSYEDFYNRYSQIKEMDNANIQSFKVMLKNRHADDQNKIVDWSDFEVAFGAHSNDFSIENKNNYIERFEDFVENFNAYLEEEEKRVDFSNFELIANTMKKAVTTYFEIRNGDREYIQNIYNSSDQSRVYNFISFNYTKCVDECAKILKEHLKSDKTRSVGNVLHIHGYIEENMIMGVNDASQIINPDFSNDSAINREIIKPQQNTDVRSNYEKRVIDTINSSNIICIYGMSIGATDKKWWSFIAKWLFANEKRVLVILSYNQLYNKRFVFAQNKLIDPIVDNFLKLSEQTDEIQSAIRSRIFVGINHNVFQMNLCEEKSASTVLEQIERITNKNDIVRIVEINDTEKEFATL